MGKALSSAVVGTALIGSLAACHSGSDSASAAPAASKSSTGKPGTGSKANSTAALEACTHAPASMSNAPFFPIPGGQAEQVTPTSTYVNACGSWLDVSMQLGLADHQAGHKVTLAVAAEHWCYANGMDAVQVASPPVSQVPAALLSACRQGIEAAGGPAATAQPTSGPGFGSGLDGS